MKGGINRTDSSFSNTLKYYIRNSRKKFAILFSIDTGWIVDSLFRQFLIFEFVESNSDFDDALVLSIPPPHLPCPLACYHFILRIELWSRRVSFAIILRAKKADGGFCIINLWPLKPPPLIYNHPLPFSVERQGKVTPNLCRR